MSRLLNYYFSQLCKMERTDGYIGGRWKRYHVPGCKLGLEVITLDLTFDELEEGTPLKILATTSPTVVSDSESEHNYMCPKHCTASFVVTVEKLPPVNQHDIQDLRRLRSHQSWIKLGLFFAVSRRRGVTIRASLACSRTKCFELLRSSRTMLPDCKCGNINMCQGSCGEGAVGGKILLDESLQVFKGTGEDKFTVYLLVDMKQADQSQIGDCSLGNCKLPDMTFLTALRDLLAADGDERESLSDVALVCGGRRFQSSRFVLAAQSHVLRRSLVWKAGNGDAGKAEIVLEEMSEACADRLVRFLHREVNVTDGLDTDIALELLRVADFYDLGCLVQACSSRLGKIMAIDNVTQLYAVAVELRLQKMQSEAIDFLASNYRDVLFKRSIGELPWQFEDFPSLISQVHERILVPDEAEEEAKM